MPGPVPGRRAPPSGPPANSTPETRCLVKRRDQGFRPASFRVEFLAGLLRAALDHGALARGEHVQERCGALAQVLDGFVQSSGLSVGLEPGRTEGSRMRASSTAKRWAWSRKARATGESISTGAATISINEYDRLASTAVSRSPSPLCRERTAWTHRRAWPTTNPAWAATTRERAANSRRVRTWLTTSTVSPRTSRPATVSVVRACVSQNRRGPRSAISRMTRARASAVTVPVATPACQRGNTRRL